MKKYFSFWAFAMLAVFSLAFVSCSDDDEPQGANPELVGAWSLQYTEGYGDSYDGFEYIQLKSDGTYIDVQEDENVSKGYTVDYGNWSVSDDKIILKLGTGILQGTTITYDIIEKENDRLTVSLLGITAYLVKVDDSVIDKYLQDEGTSTDQLSVNGIVWEYSSYSPNTFWGVYDGDYYYNLEATVYREAANLSQITAPDYVNFTIYSKYIRKGDYIKGEYVDIKEGMDITNATDFNWEKEGGAMCCEVTLCENMLQMEENKPMVFGDYSQVESGHAYIEKIENEALTIRFDNLKLKLAEGYSNSFWESEGFEVSTPETITLNGTIVYTLRE